MSSPSRRQRLSCLVLTLSALGGTSPAMADTPANGATASARAAAEGARPRLVTDGALRQGMERIAVLLAPAVATPQAEALPARDYVAMADGVAQQLAAMVTQCRLPPASDQAFHEILMDLNRGVDLMGSGKPVLQKAGVLALTQALRNYGKFFDHPGWGALGAGLTPPTRRAAAG